MQIKNLEIELDKLKDPYNQEGLSEVDTQNISKLQDEIDTKLKMVVIGLDKMCIKSLKITHNINKFETRKLEIW